MQTHKFLLAALVLALAAGPGSPRSTAGGLLREVYTGIPGSSLTDLLTDPKYPDQPDSTGILPDFEAPIDVGQDYGQRVRGYLMPPQSGHYIFWISSDDASALYLSTNRFPTGKMTIAGVTGWTASREWTKYASQQSSAIWLEANQLCYVEAIMKQGYGGDNLAVRWQLPDGTMEEPVPEVRLLPWGTSFGPPEIIVQPTNLTVIEGQPASFSVVVTNQDPVVYQWQRNQRDLADGTNATYTISVTTWADRGAQFRCRVSNNLGSIMSAQATLTVLPKGTPPTITSVQNHGRGLVSVLFSELVDNASANTASNYAIDGGVTVRSAALQSDGRTVNLYTTDLTYGLAYTVTINNVKDRAAVPNTIAPNSRASFVAAEFSGGGIGLPGQPGTVMPVPGGLDVIGAGSGIGTNADQLRFAYEERTGDFDVRVRLQTLEDADVWAMAGLMARATLQTNSAFAAILATPSISGIYFAARVSTNASTLAGGLPVNYPWTWLRLKRAGDVFTGYASFDGVTWAPAGLATNPMPATVLFGLSVSSRSTNLTARAQFRDQSDVTGGVTGRLMAEREDLGPSSRHTGLIISEIMYHPASRPDGLNGEFIELFNSQPIAEDLGGYRLSGAINFTFPAQTLIPGGGFLVVARAPADVRAIYGLTQVLGGYANGLPHDSATLRLENELGAVLLKVSYSHDAPWPAAAAGGGHSLVLTRPSLGEGEPAAWSASQFRGGSPGALDGIQPEPLQAVVINEWLAHTDLPQVDYIELYNHGNQTVDLSGAILTDNPATNKFRIPAGTTLGPRGFIVFTQNDLGFALTAGGEAIFLFNRDQTRVIDAVRFGAQVNGVASGRFPDGAPGMHELRTPTPGAPNADLLIRDVVINEIMYHPISEDDNDQYVELYNRGPQAVALANWRFISGVDFTFPAHAVIPSGGFVVVAKNPARLMTNYPGLNASIVFGGFQGRLAGGGERLTLARPDDPALPYQDFVVMDEVTYGDGGRWGNWSDGGGSSLELVDAHSDHRRAANWADSDESGKAAWTTIEATDVLDIGNSSFPANSLQIMLMGEGECLIDDVEVIDPKGANLVANSSFEAGLAGWRMGGTHVRSTWESNSGVRGSACLHLRASARGVNDANNARTDLVSSLSPGGYATLRAKVRWLRGNPEILLRVRGNYVEAAGRMTLPRNLGTPGAPNSRAASNLGPAIFAVQHTPVLPALNEAVVVTARVHDPDGVSSVRLRYRVDPSPGVTSVVMVDDGTGADAVAGDGLFTAIIAGQPTNNLVAFSIQAFDNSPQRLGSLFPADAPARECLVRWGEMAPLGNVPTYRIWMTQSVLDQWRDGPPSSGEPLDVTFAYGNSRAVYNVGGLYSGSPFHWTGYNGPTGNNCTYALRFPNDDRFLGSADVLLKMPSNLGSDPAVQREQFFHWMAGEMGLPHIYRRLCYLFVNGLRRATVYEDTQRPNGEFVKEWYAGDPGGDLYKVDDWFEFDDDAIGFVNIDATLENFMGANGEKKRSRYRWNWRKRAVNGSAHDYSNVFALVDALNTPEPEYYGQQIEALVDVEQWMRVFASRHLCGDWDAYGYRRGKNMFAYKPTQGRWQLLNDDISFDFGLGDSPTHDLYDVSHFDGTLDLVSQRMYNHPPFRRAYLRALQGALDGPLRNEPVNGALDPKYASMRANNIPAQSPASIKTWITNRRTYILQQLATNAAPFAITNHGGADFVVADRNLLVLSGAAPVQCGTILVNGTPGAFTWTSVTNWSLRLALRAGLNPIHLQGLGNQGDPNPANQASINVTFNGADERPEQRIVFSEIMYHPSKPDTGFVELYNRSTSYTFDLSGYRLRGVDFTFGQGTLIEPGAYLLVVNNRAAFVAAYGYRAPIAGEFKGRLRNDGETLSLVKPGANGGPDLMVDQVTYSDRWPWPSQADGQGPSLQLVDLNADNRQIGAWAAVGADDGAGDGWKLFSVTGQAQSQQLYIYLVSSGDVYLDDVSLVAGTVPEVGTNVVKNGDFESSLSGTWTISQDDPQTQLTTAVKHSGQDCLHLVSTHGGLSLLPSISQITGSISPGAIYTLSFWYLPSTNGGGLTAGLLGSPLEQTVSIVPATIGLQPATPGAPNSIQTNLPPLPTVWLNEVQPVNVTGPADAAGHKEPWLELYNPGPVAVALADCYLGIDSTNVFQWSFPATASIPAGGFFLVWADGQAAESSATEFHTNFRLDATAGAVALSKRIDGQPFVLDYLAYSQVPAGQAFGSFPDGDPIARQLLFHPTPAAPNNNQAAPAKVLINEWLASNRATLPDPADNHFDDWFELYNPNDQPVTLAGYTLTDDLARPRQWVVPAGTTIAPLGFLLIWADNETQQNNTGTGLHCNFQLDRAGELIALFAPDGSQVDLVRFGPQTPDVSEGRFPDGAAEPFVFMPEPSPGGPNVFTRPEPTITQAVLTANGLQITWTTVVGQRYQVQFKDDLGQLTWQVLGDTMTAVDKLLSVTDNSALTHAQRYFRIVRMQ